MRCWYQDSIQASIGVSSLQEKIIPTLDTSALIIAYVVIAALLLGLNLNASWHWLVKTLVNGIVAGFFFITYHSWPGILGWPTERDLPQQFYLHAINVDEPNNIYFWGTDLGRGLGMTVPRSYAVPYTASLHDKANKASRKLSNSLMLHKTSFPARTEKTTNPRRPVR